MARAGLPCRCDVRCSRARGAVLRGGGGPRRPPMMSAWHSSGASQLALPKLYDLDEVVEAVEAAGFEVSVARLRVWFVPSHHDGADTSIARAWWTGSATYARDTFLFGHASASAMTPP